MSKAPEWIFPTPVAGRWSGGNANQFTVPPDLETLVRETVQNALDARRAPGASVFVRFRVVELAGSHRENFLKAIGFADLRPHLEAVTRDPTHVGRSLADGLRRFDTDAKLLCLYVEDAGTQGLRGDEEGHSPFAALVRNDLDSRKSTTTAGGSYGLGKAVLWQCSSIRTALFGSIVADREAEGIRLIAKADLATHEFRSERCDGAGWFGVHDKDAGYAVSMWGRTDLAKSLSLDRADLPADVPKTGTSIGIVGFHDPSSDEPKTPERLVQELEAHIALFFWPALLVGRLRSEVVFQQNSTVRARRVVDPVNTVPDYCRLLDVHRRGVDAEDVIVRDVPITVPATKPNVQGVTAHAQTQTNAKLLARVVETEDAGGGQPGNVVARIRGAWMVVDYKQFAGISSPGRTFFAVLLAGEAVDGSPANVAADQLLRIAEPPAHDSWNNKRSLSEAYSRGVLTRLAEFEQATRTVLVDAIRPPLPDDEEGPEDLKRMLALLLPESEERARIKAVSASVENGAWLVHARIEIPEFDDDVHRAFVPRLQLGVDGGRPVTIPWAASSLQVVSPSTGVRVDGNELVAAGGLRRIEFTARTDASAQPVNAAETVAQLSCHMREIKEP